MGKVTGFIEFQRLQEAAEDSRQRMVNFFVEHTVGVDWKKVRLSKASGELAAITRP